MNNWEYKTLQFDTKGFSGGILDVESFNETLNRYGSNGWELVSCFGTNQSYGASRYILAVLKRQVRL
ncbi:MAG: DUF4177 domain-containing protein [Caldicoprobacterales bacterium]|nr:DUF4177 domain-containing protein [Clostridiales bacterium]